MLTLASLCLLAVGGVGAVQDEQAERQAARVPAVVPAEARSVPNPVPADERSLEFGKLLFSSQCVMCHGKTGAGDGDLVPRLNIVVPDLTDPASIKNRTDGELFYILTNGHGSMPGQQSRYDEQTRWDLVNHIRTLPVDAP